MSADRSSKYENFVAVDRKGKILMSDGTGDCGKLKKEFDIFAKAQKRMWRNM